MSSFVLSVDETETDVSGLMYLDQNSRWWWDLTEESQWWRDYMDLSRSFSITVISVDVIFYRQNWLRAGPKNSQTYHCSDSHNHSPDLQAQWQLRTIYVDIHQEHPRWKKTAK